MFRLNAKTKRQQNTVFNGANKTPDVKYEERLIAPDSSVMKATSHDDSASIPRELIGEELKNSTPRFTLFSDTHVPILGILIGITGLCLQIFLLYPWHVELSRQLDDLQVRELARNIELMV